jgi:hypothetical protein
MKNLDQKWHLRVMQLKCPQRNGLDSIEFDELVEMACYTNDPEVVRTLLHSLSDDDCGSLEQSVYGVLGSVALELYYKVYVNELGNLINVMPHRCVQLLDYTGRKITEIEVSKICHELAFTYGSVSPDVLKKLCEFIRDKNYLNEFPYSSFFYLLEKHS